jgi:hypothetical protein
MMPILVRKTRLRTVKDWIKIYAHPRSPPTYYKRGRKWALVYYISGETGRGQLAVAFNQTELKRLHAEVELLKELNGSKYQWYEAHIIDIEDAIGVEIEDEAY